MEDVCGVWILNGAANLTSAMYTWGPLLIYVLFVCNASFKLSAQFSALPLCSQHTTFSLEYQEETAGALDIQR